MLVRRLHVKAKFIIVTALVLASSLVLASLCLYGSDETLRIRSGGGSDIQTMDPAYSTAAEFEEDFAIFSKLIRFKPGSPETEYDAAASISVSEDGLNISFTLKEGIQFHKGYGEMTADDVKFSFERIADPESESPYAGAWATLESVEVTGRYTGVIHLSAPLAALFTSTLPSNAGSILSKKAYLELGERFRTSPIGSGPYYWYEWRPNEKLVLERFEDYYDAKPYFKRVEIYPIGDVLAAEIAFDAGELDVTEISLDSLERYQENPDVDVHVLTETRYHHLGFNTALPPFDDLRVRKAVRYAIDVDEVIAGAYNGLPERNDSQLPPGFVGYWEDAPRHQPDLERARELLEQAGYGGGFDTTLYITPRLQYQRSAQIIQQQLAKIGIVATIQEDEPQYPILGEQSTPGLYYTSYQGGGFDPSTWFQYHTCEMGIWNWWKWCNKEHDELLTKGLSTSDIAERNRIYIRVQQIIYDEVPAVFITNGAKVSVSRPEIKPFFVAHLAQYMYFNGD